MPEDNKNRVAQSMKAAASMTGFKIDAIKRAKKAGCPAFKGSRVYLDELDAWLGQHADLLDLSPAERLDFETKAIKKAQAQFDFDLKRGDYIHRHEVVTHIGKTEKDTKQKLRKFLYNELPAKGEMLDRAGLRELCEDFFVQMCKDRQEAFGQWTSN